MKILRYILTDNGIVLIVEGELSDQARSDLRRDFDAWAQMVGGHHFPVIVLPGDENTKVDDLRGTANDPKPIFGFGLQGKT